MNVRHAIRVDTNVLVIPEKKINWQTLLEHQRLGYALTIDYA